MADIVWNTTQGQARRYVSGVTRDLIDGEWVGVGVSPELVWVPLTEPAEVGDRLLATVPCPTCEGDVAAIDLTYDSSGEVDGSNYWRCPNCDDGDVVVWSMDINTVIPVIDEVQEAYEGPECIERGYSRGHLPGRHWPKWDGSLDWDDGYDVPGDWSSAVCAVSGPIKETNNG